MHDLQHPIVIRKSDCRKLKFIATDGKKYATECADVEGLLRIIQAVPSPKAEPLKQWLARVGYERIEETKDPEKAMGGMEICSHVW